MHLKTPFHCHIYLEVFFANQLDKQTTDRTADRIIGQGKDIPDINCLVEEIKEKCPSITIYTIKKTDFNLHEKCVPKNLTTFKGTLQVYEVLWSSTKKETLYMRRLTCTECDNGTKCNHYSIGEVLIPTESLTDLHPHILLMYKFKLAHIEYCKLLHCLNVLGT